MSNEFFIGVSLFLLCAGSIICWGECCSECCSECCDELWNNDQPGIEEQSTTVSPISNII